MQTRKIALLSTMLIGLGGAATAQQATDTGQAQQPGQTQGQTTQQQQATDPGQEPFLEQDQDQTTQQQATDPGQEPLLEQDQTTQQQTTPGAADDAETAEEMDARTQQQEGLAQEGTDPQATDQDLVEDQQQQQQRTPSVTRAPEGYTGTVMGGMTAEDLIGMNVVSAEGNNVGSISDLLIGADNNVDRAIIDVGGFLGFGARSVAVELDRLMIAEGDDEVVINATREQLDAMPEWQADDEGWFTN